MRCVIRRGTRCSSRSRSSTWWSCVRAPSIPVIGIALWWKANTIAHNFIHCPFFRSRRAEPRVLDLLSALLGIPQGLWRARHLRHHGGVDRPLPLDAEMLRRNSGRRRVVGGAGGPAPRFFSACTCLATRLDSACASCRGTSSTRAGRPVTTAGSITGASSTTGITPSITCGRASIGRACRDAPHAGARASRLAAGAAVARPAVHASSGSNAACCDRRGCSGSSCARTSGRSGRCCRASPRRRPRDHRRRRPVPADRARAAAVAARRDADDRRCASRSNLEIARRSGSSVGRRAAARAVRSGLRPTTPISS